MLLEPLNDRSIETAGVCALPEKEVDKFSRATEVTNFSMGYYGIASVYSRLASREVSVNVFA